MHSRPVRGVEGMSLQLITDVSLCAIFFFQYRATPFCIDRGLLVSGTLVKSCAVILFHIVTTIDY